MQRTKLLLFWLASAAMLSAASAAINVSGTVVYTENFDTLPTGPGRAEFNWTDNTTITGFYLHRSNTPAVQTSLAGSLATATSRPFISDGGEIATAAPNFHGFLSLGAYNSNERALGFCPTTTDGSTNWSGGTLSLVALVTNTGATSTDLTSISFDIESRRGNSVATNAETVSFTAKTGAAAALLSELGTATTSATFTQTGHNSVAITGGGTFDYTSPDGFTSTPGVPPASVTLTGTLATPIRLAPGQSIALRWGNVNDGGTDAQVGIDNLSLGFTGVSSSVIPAVSNIVRHNNATPADPSDDTVDFTLTVAGLGTVNPAGWTISAPPVLAGQTGTYGAARNFTAVPIAQFTGAQHTLDVVVEDQGNPSTNAIATVTAPWCVLQAAISTVRDEKATADPADDTWNYTVTVTGQFTGAGWTSDNAAFPNGSYGAPQTVTDLPIATPSQTIIFTDGADATCTVTAMPAAVRFIGTKNFGAPQILRTDAGGVPAPWVLDEVAFTQSMNNGGGAPAKVYRSEFVDLSTVSGAVSFTAALITTDTSSGFEAGDTFLAQLILHDGIANSTVNLITPFDTDLNGILQGTELAATGVGRTLNLSQLIPDHVVSAQLVISGANDSLSETMSVHDILFQVAPHSISITSGGALVFNNRNTVDPADDSFTQPVNIAVANPPAGSTGWTSASPPGSGLYSAANPVSFGPFPVSAGPQSIQLADNNVPAVTSNTLTITPPAPAFTATLVAGSVLRNPIGPGDGDDTVSFGVTISGTNGGPAFALTSYPALATAPGLVMPAAPAVVTVTLTPAPEHGTVVVGIADASYPATKVNIPIAIPAVSVPVTQYVLGQKNLGGGLSDVVTAAGALAPEWFNYPALRTLEMTSGGGAPAKVVTSEVISLTGINSDVSFTANLRAIDRSAGFEAVDTFRAQLILDGNAANPVNLITSYDTFAPANGVMNGGGTAAEDEFNALHAADGTYTFNFPLSHIIPDAVDNVQLVLTAANDSTNETFVVENVLFALSIPAVDTDGDGMTDDYEDANGLDKNSAADKNLDLDGDGQTNYQEFLAGNAANDSASVLKITTAQRNGNFASVTWNSVPGKIYRIEISPNMANWTDAGNNYPASPGPATQTSTSLDLAALGNPIPGKYFLRVRVRAP